MGHPVLKALAEVTADEGPRFVEPDVLLLEKLGLYLQVRPVKEPDRSSGLFIGLFEAWHEGQRTRIGVTCVGIPPDAVEDATANWCAGVLPVLTHWRGGHGCLTGTETLRSPAGTFNVIKGPVVVRGEREGGSNPTIDDYLSLLSEPLVRARIGRRVPWLECFAIRMDDGSIEATCRLDNRDRAPGQRLLAADARRWPGTTPGFDSRRQLLLLVPEGESEPEPPSFWARLFGRG
jgi:hypothetical protein